MPFPNIKNQRDLNHFYSRTQEIEKSAQRNGFRKPCYYNSKGDSYRGEWKNDRREGVGIVTLTSGNKSYIGEFKNNARNGFGLLVKFLPECNVYFQTYRGEWKDGYKEGKGTNYFKNGNLYSGEWKRGQIHGYGRMWYKDKSFYDGDWVQNKKHGLGLFVFSDNSKKFEGNWIDDKKEGFGKYYHLDSGQMQSGVWKNDQCVYSTMIDIPYRSACLDPSNYPIINTQLSDEATKKFQSKAKIEAMESCLMSFPSIAESSRLSSYFAGLNNKHSYF